MEKGNLEVNSNIHNSHERKRIWILNLADIQRYEVITSRLKGTTIQKHCFILFFLEFSDNFSHRVHKTETRENKTNASQMDGRTNLCITFAPPKKINNIPPPVSLLHAQRHKRRIIMEAPAVHKNPKLSFLVVLTLRLLPAPPPVTLSLSLSSSLIFPVGNLY